MDKRTHPNRVTHTSLSTDDLVSPFEQNIWGTKDQLTKEMVRECIKYGWWKSKPIFPEEDHTNTILHAERVAYLSQNFDSNRIVDVEIQYTDKDEPYYWVVDGNHFLASACILGIPEVRCSIVDTRGLTSPH